MSFGLTKSLVPTLARPFAAVVPAMAPAHAQDAPDLSAAPAGEYVADAGHAYISFSYSHQGYSRPLLRWRDWTGSLDWNPDAPEESSVEVTIQAASIDSGVDKFDEHLRSADFFEVETHPTITFRSTGIERTGDATGVMTGVLTVKGEEKPVTLDVQFNKAGAMRNDAGHKLGFSARGEVSRTELGVGKYAPVVGDEVDLVIEVEFEKPNA